MPDSGTPDPGTSNSGTPDPGTSNSGTHPSNDDTEDATPTDEPATGPGTDTSATQGEAVRELHLANWTDRFIAWVIDVLVVGAVLAAIGEAVGFISVLTGGAVFGGPFFGWNGVGFWAYWTLLEGSRGQSAGKMVMHIRVTDERGEPIDYATAAVESLGKAFLLPIDCLVGWLAWEGEYVRLFNRLSDTIVIEDTEPQHPPDGVEYVKPGE